VPALHDLQKGVRDALILDDVSGLDSVLVGGRDARKRLAIHQRHYRTSLITALLDRFPATVWLLGSTFVTEAARRFVREHPPSRPCITEYGDDFPAFLSGLPGAADFPYVRSFAELEWHLGRVSLAIERPAVTSADLAKIGADHVAGLAVLLQPGVQYLHAAWAVDDLMRLFLTDSAPDRFTLDEGEVWIELRGARGEMQMNRLDGGTFTFRVALSAGQSLAEAADSALDVDETFDAGLALAALISEGLVTATDHPSQEGSI
jgi:putative DNA-binding protein